MDRLPALIAALLLLPAAAPAATVRGSVISFPDGAPLAGIQVLARDPQGRSAAAWTDADGAFAVLDVEPGAVRVQAVPPDIVNRIGAYFGDVSAFCAAPATRLGPEDVLDGVLIELPVGGTIDGTVDGVGVGAVITAEGADTLNLSVRRTASVDSEAFAVTGLSSWVDADGAFVPGAYRISATDGRGGRFWYPGTWDREEAELVPAVRGEVTTIAFERPVGSLLRACLVDPGGGARPGAAFTISASEGAFAGATDADGCFVWGDLPGLAFTLTVADEGLATTVFAGLPPGDVGALVVDDEAILQLDGADRIGLAAPGAPPTQLFDAVDGVVRGLPPGTWDVLAPPFPTVDALPVRASVALVAGSTVPLSVVPPPAGTVEVTVARRADGFGLRGARVEALDPDSGAVLGVATSAEGSARLTALPVTPLLVRATWDPFCPADDGLVPVWSGPARGEPWAAALTPLPDAEVLGPLLTLVLPPDADRDGMDDVWELLSGLRTHWNDSNDDLDGDGVVNVDEYRASTDPRDSASSGCSLGGSTPTCPSGHPALILAVLGALVVTQRRRG